MLVRMPPFRSFLPPLNFITVHYAYFIIVSLLTSLIFWGSSSPRFSISYVDSLFLVISAMTEAGLNSVNLSQMTTWQQVLLWLLIITGSSIWVSIWTILVRKHAFERRFQEIVKRERERSNERRKSANLSLVPFTQRLRSFSKSKTSASEPPSTPVRPGGIGSSRRTGGSILPISGPINGRPASIVIPPKEISGESSDKATSTTQESSPFPMTTTKEELDEQKVSSDGVVGRDYTVNRPPTNSEHIAFADQPLARSISSTFHSHGLTQRHPTNAEPSSPTLAASTAIDEPYHPGFHKIGRNAQFHGLTIEERDKLGGTEYRALRLLSIVVPLYFVLWQLLGSIALGAWIAINQPSPALDNAISPWWNGIFNGVSAFNNSGMSVLDLNMIPYGGSYFVLIVMGAMILAGNTAYPIFLRLGLWCGLKLLKFVTYEHDFVEWKTTLEYILKYPRRVYTNLFPSRQTWWLVFMLFVLNGTDWAAFEILNFGNPNLDHISVGSRVIDGLFQALAVRSGGFYVVSISTVYIGLQVLYVIMMYISVYPVVITMRHSNVYEERSLGIYDSENTNHDDFLSRPLSPARPGGKIEGLGLGRVLRRRFSEWHGVGAVPNRRSSHIDEFDESRIDFISHQVRGQLSHDLWWLVLAVLFIMIIETRHFLEDPVTYSVFNVVFEVVSAYGCVGISIGLPNQAYSFSGGLYTGSKLVLCAVMLRGRHRGLPVALDRAVRLPGDEMHRVEEEDHDIRRSMSIRRPSVSYTH